MKHKANRPKDRESVDVDTVDTRLNPYILTFRHKPLELNFNDSWRKAALPTNRIWASAAVVFYVGMSLLLYDRWPGNYVEDQWFRMFVCLPLLAVETALAFRKRIQGRFFDSMYLITALPLYGNAAIWFLIAPYELKMFFLLETALIYIFAINYFRVRFYRAAIFALLAGCMGGYSVIQVGLDAQVPVIRITFEIAAVGGLAFTGIFASYSREVLARHNYLDRLKARTYRTRAEALADEAVADARAKSRFLTAVGNELQGPVHKVLVQSDLSPDQMSEASNAGAYMSDIHESASRLDRIINQVLIAARADAGDMPARPMEIRLSDAVNLALEQAWSRIEEQSLRVNVQHDDIRVTVFADPGMVRQSLEHILSNAIKFSPRESEIHIQTSVRDDGQVALSVIDHGPGIAPDKIRQVTEAFVQLDDGLERRHEGLGLGLTLARNLMQANGGSLEIDSAPGDGTSASLLFPTRLARAA